MCKVIKMCSSIWILGIFTTVIAGVTGSELLHNDIVEVRKCYLCEEQRVENGTTSPCDNRTMQSIECPSDKQYCAIEALSPSFTSTLRCAANKTPSLLYFANTSGVSYRMTCICDSQLCNRPLPESLVRELKEFSAQTLNVTDGTDVTDLFHNSSIAHRQLDNRKFYEKLCSTKELSDFNNTESTTTSLSPPVVTLNFPTNKNVSKSVDSPRAEALKHEVTAPSDDEEDDGEGSGGWSDERPPRRPAPADPSSYLPAHENKGSSLFINLLVTTPLLLYVII